MPTFIIPLLYLVIIFRDPRLLCCKHCPSWFFNRLQSKLFPPGANLQCLLCKLAFSYFLSRRKFLCYCAHCDKIPFFCPIFQLYPLFIYFWAKISCLLTLCFFPICLKSAVACFASQTKYQLFIYIQLKIGITYVLKLEFCLSVLQQKACQEDTEENVCSSS